MATDAKKIEDMREQVGLLAGKVWQAVGAQPGILATQVVKALGVDGPLVAMAAGWLAREEKVRIEPKGKDFRLWLTETEQRAFAPAEKK